MGVDSLAIILPFPGIDDGLGSAKNTVPTDVQKPWPALDCDQALIARQEPDVENLPREKRIEEPLRLVRLHEDLFDMLLRRGDDLRLHPFRVCKKEPALREAELIAWDDLEKDRKIVRVVISKRLVELVGRDLVSFGIEEVAQEFVIPRQPDSVHVRDDGDVHGFFFLRRISATRVSQLFSARRFSRSLRVKTPFLALADLFLNWRRITLQRCLGANSESFLRCFRS